MISLEGAVSIVIYIVVGGAVFGLLYMLIVLVSRLFAGEAAAMFMKVGTLVLAILAVLVLIGLLLSLITGKPIFRTNEKGLGSKTNYVSTLLS